MLGWPLLHCCARKEGFSGLECVWERLPETPLIRAQCCSVRCGPRCWHKACADPLTVAQTSQRRKPRGHQYSPTGTMCEILLCSRVASLFCFDIYSSVKIQHSNWMNGSRREVLLFMFPAFRLSSLSSYFTSLNFGFHKKSEILCDSVQNNQCNRCSFFLVPAQFGFHHQRFRDVVWPSIFVVSTTHSKSHSSCLSAKQPISHLVWQTPTISNCNFNKQLSKNQPAKLMWVQVMWFAIC